MEAVRLLLDATADADKAVLDLLLALQSKLLNKGVI